MSSSSPGTRSSVRKPRRKAPALAKSVRCDDKRLYITLEDGRVVSALLTPRLKKASPKQRARWRIEGFGTAIYWPDVDEDIGVAHVIGIPEDELYDYAGFTSGTPHDVLDESRRTNPRKRH